MKLKKITFNFPGKTILEDYQEMFARAYFGEDMTAFELADFASTYDDLDTMLMVQNMCIMLCLTRQKFVIYEDETYMVGDKYLGNAEMRLEMEEYPYILIETED